MENFRLKVFRAVARHASFSRAGQELLLTQPAVTQQIKALEEEYGVPLFDRSAGRIRLTAAGKALLPYAERLKSLADEAFAAVTQVSGSLGGSLTVAASQTIGQYVLPSMIAGFLRQHPRVQVLVKGGNTAAVLDMLVERCVNLALIEGPALRSGVHVEPFMEDHLALVVPAGHEWAEHPVELEALRGAPLLMREFGSGSRRIVELALSRAGLPVKELTIAFELDSTEGLLAAVEAGLGVTFVSRWAVRNQLRLGTLKLAHVRGLQLERMFSLAYLSGPEPSGLAGAFRRFLLQAWMEKEPQLTRPTLPAQQARSPRSAARAKVGKSSK